MSVLERLVEVWASDGTGRGMSGSGFVLGANGVVTCRHVIQPYLEWIDARSAVGTAGPGGAALQVRPGLSVAPSGWVDCTLEWRHPTLDLALLRIDGPVDHTWSAGPGPSMAAMGGAPLSCSCIGFPQSNTRSGEPRDTEQAEGRLLPAGRARDEDRLVPLDVDISVPEHSALWRGMSGAAVFDGSPDPRLLAIVTKASPGRQERRLLVLPLAYGADDPGFQAAARRLRFDPTVEVWEAPAWRRSVTHRSLSPRGTPLPSTDVEMEDLGVHASAVAKAVVRGYLARDRDADLDAALEEARTGGRRLVLVVGDAAAGKTRSALEALRRHPVMRTWPVVVPLPDGGIGRLAADHLLREEAVLWLDDLDSYLSQGLNMAVVDRLLGDAVGVATMRRGNVKERDLQLSDPATEYLTDDRKVTRITLDAVLGEGELARAAGLIEDPDLGSDLRQGVGLGEWIVAGRQLMERLDEGDAARKSFASLVVGWARTGVGQPLPRSDARRVWTGILPPPFRSRLEARGDAARAQFFDDVVRWATEPVLDRPLFEQALISESPGGFTAHDYVVDQVTRSPDRPPVPDALWDLALKAASTPVAGSLVSGRLYRLANAAFGEGATTHEKAAMEILAGTGDLLARNIVASILWIREHRAEEALRVFGGVAGHAESNDPAVRYQVIRALIYQGDILMRLQKPTEAAKSYRAAVDRFSRDNDPELQRFAAAALVGWGYALLPLLEWGQATAVFERVVTDYDDFADNELRYQVSEALLGKAFVLHTMRKPDEALQAFEAVTDRCEHFGLLTDKLRLDSVRALVGKGAMLVELQRYGDAVETFDKVIDRYGDSLEGWIRREVARARVDRAVALSWLGQRGDVLRACNEVEASYGGSSDPALREQAARAAGLRQSITAGQG